MGQEGRMLAEKSKIRDGLKYLQDISKEEVIQKCYDLALSLGKANDDATTCNMLLKEVFTELKQLKAKTPHIDEAEYKKSWSWVNKTGFVLKKIKRHCFQ
jgi:hypothetical protein